MRREKRMSCIRTPGKKSEPHLDPADPPRRRANKARGHGTYANDRPPIVGTLGRHTGKVSRRMLEHTAGQPLGAEVEPFPPHARHVATNTWRVYQQVAL